MGKQGKRQERLKNLPKDFTFEELKSLLAALGFEVSHQGRTSGSRVRFIKGNLSIVLHKPHSRNILLLYQMKQILDILTKEGLM